MKVKIWFDFVCPFCYLGETKFMLALDQFEYKDEVELEFKSFQLRMANDHTAGKDVYQVVADKYGISREESKNNHQGIVNAGKAVGLAYDFDSMKLNDTQLAHETMQYAKEHGKAQALIARLLKACFEEGLDIGDEAVLFPLAKGAGLDLVDLKAQLTSGTLKEAVAKDEEEARRRGIHTIPTFVIDDKFGISGAQEPESFLRALRQAYASRQG